MFARYPSGIWVQAETSDVSVRKGNCYLELVDKTPGGETRAKLRASIWGQNYYRVAAKFRAVTGRDFDSGMKVSVAVDVTYHSVYGLSLSIVDIDPAFTVGDAVRRRLEILRRLTENGIIDQNKQLPMPVPALRIAVISAPLAAGYGDFVNQLYSNPSRLRFHARLFEAVMQGEKTAASVTAALDRILAEQENWDIVVIIRGGGATSDLEGFDNYDLAERIALCDLPVVVGIGHERDTTVLDYVAFKRVKTPTAAAEWLISEATALLERLRAIGNAILLGVSDRVSGASEQLSALSARLAFAPEAATERARGRLQQIASQLASAGSRGIAARRQGLASQEGRLRMIPGVRLAKETDRLKFIEEKINILSPAATLSRGYSITRFGGHALTDASPLSPGVEVETILASGRFTSTIKSFEKKHDDSHV